MMKWILAPTAVVLFALAYVGQLTTGTEHGASAVTSPATRGLRLPTSTRITRSSDLSTLSPSDSRYRVTCKVACDTLSFHTPVITVRDGERVTISDTSQTEHVIATRTDGDVTVPIARDLTQGSLFEITVLAVDQDTALIDVAATLQSVKRVARAGTSDSLRVNTLSGRFMETSRLGSKASASFGQKEVWTLEVTVQPGRCSSSSSAGSE
jgi:hypothetical protein